MTSPTYGTRSKSGAIAGRAATAIVTSGDARWMSAIAGSDRNNWRDDVGLFGAGSPFATDVGIEVLRSPRGGWIAYVPVGSINLPVLQALAFARAVAPRVTGVHVTDDLEEAQELQTKWRVNVTGPTTLSAVLSSLQMGFTTLTIQRRSSEVCRTPTQFAWHLNAAATTASRHHRSR